MKIEWIEKLLTEAEQMMYANKVEEGLNLLNGLLYDEPGYGSLHNHLGWAYFYYTADVTRAELHLKMSIKFDATFAAPYLHLGNLLIRTGRHGEALQYLQLGLQQYEANRAAFLESIAHAYELQRAYGKAIKSYREAMASTIGFETAQLMEGIRRCRKKRWVMLFSF